MEEIFEARKQPAGVSTGLKAPKYGVVEDFQPKFVKTEVPKRPLSAANAKAEKVKMTAAAAVKTEKVLEKAVKEVEKEPEEKAALKIPKTPFVNTEKVEKRPLSKSVYQKKVIAPVEEPSGPVTIITKPEKDSKIGMVVAIILTIILGATAGTVAFLLLPK
ncbi:MAG: hypothetical protein Q4B34_01170 [Candidatus Saccharibacteria bacterium]|nr:hypothetical protein [Candidatus Saccharibacteria bacterium]